MPVAGHLVAKHGSRPVTGIAALCFALALALPARAPTFAILLAALVALGLANGVLDVAMNAQAAAVQQRYVVPIMGRVHALYSCGGLVGAVIGGRVAAAGILPVTHLTAVGLTIAAGASAVLLGMPTHGVGDDVVTHEPRANMRATGELEAVHSGARPEQRATSHAREVAWHPTEGGTNERPGQESGPFAFT